MKSERWIIVALSLILLLITSACYTSYTNVPETFQDHKLAGTWEAYYDRGITDRLIIRTDGTFKQIYHDNTENYHFESLWGKWWVERSPDGRVRLHLQGARHYRYGIDIAEEEGIRRPSCADDEPYCWRGAEALPRLFYDPIANEGVEMVGKLVLNVQSDSEQIVLLHIVRSSDEGYRSLFTGRAAGFERVAAP